MDPRAAARALGGMLADLAAVVGLAVVLSALAWGVAEVAGRPLASFTGSWRMTLQDGSTLAGRGEDSLRRAVRRHAGAIAATRMVDDGRNLLGNVTVWALLLTTTALGGWAAFRQRGHLRERLRVRARDVPWAIGATVLTLVAGAGVLAAMHAWGALPPDLAGVPEGSARGRLALLALVGVLGPLAEELYFRGRLWDLWTPALGQGGALALSAVAFAAVHLTWLTPLWPVSVLQVAMGVVLGALRRRTGRLGPGMLAHAAHNTIGFALVT